MEQLKKAISDFLSASRAERENGLEINTGSLAKDIHMLLDKEKAALKAKIEEEEKHVKNLEKRYNSLRSGGDQDVSTENYHGDIKSKMSKIFILQRSEASDEVRSDEKREFLSKKESDFLQFIAQDSLDFCKQKAETQREQLDNALKIKEKNDATTKPDDQCEELHDFQVHLENDSIPFLFKEYMSCWEERIKHVELKNPTPGKKVKTFIRSCIDLCWLMTIHTKNYYFDWEKTSEGIQCVSHEKQKDSKDCDIRVFHPALMDGQDLIVKGKSMCVSCVDKNMEHGNETQPKNSNASSYRSNNRDCASSSDVRVEIHDQKLPKSKDLKERHQQRNEQREQYPCTDASNIDKSIQKCDSPRSRQSSLKSNTPESSKHLKIKASQPDSLNF